MSLETVSENSCFDGIQGVYSHQSSETGTTMRFAAFTPAAANDGPVPVLWYLSGLTCTEENFTVKAGAQRLAAELGVMVIAPDTSPRGANIDGEDESYDFGSGAGFYVDALVKPWSDHYRMYSYITEELPSIIFSEFNADEFAQSIFGHSMGGHGALTIALKNPDRFKSVSAFSPIVAPTQCPWGHKALGGYLGEDKSEWVKYDATELVTAGHRCGPILIDQGTADEFMEGQLKPELFLHACDKAGQALELRYQEGYDHSYYFISTFMEDHMRFHAEHLGNA